MIRVADYVMARCAAAGLRRAFLVTGGAAMFLNDALRRETAIAYTCMHHEQAAAMAAEGYARVSGRPAIVSVSSGPGAINALNGVFGAWTDSLPMIVVSGQVKRETCMGSYPGLRVRQLGDQEVDIVPMVKGITKYATCLTDPGEVRCERRAGAVACDSRAPGSRVARHPRRRAELSGRRVRAVRLRSRRRARRGGRRRGRDGPRRARSPGGGASVL